MKNSILKIIETPGVCIMSVLFHFSVMKCWTNCGLCNMLPCPLVKSCSAPTHPPTTAYQRKTVSSDKTESWRSYRGRGRVKRAGEGEWTLQVKQSNKDDHQIRKQSEWKVYDYAIYYILISKRIRNPRSNTSNDIKFHWNHLFIVWHKHRQRHNGPEGWVHITRSYTNLDKISISESRLSI